MIKEKLDLSRSTGEPTAFYPPIEPYNTGRLRVSDLHELYYEEVGNPDGKPAVLLHGGPGAGLIPLYRQAFDPEKYRVVLFDQRGCGRSTPRGELRDNTTWDIVADIEKLREHLAIELRGIWLARKAEIDWDFGHGANWVFPKEWEQFESHIPVEERDDLIEAYYRRLSSDDENVRLAAGRAWGIWESCKFSLVPNPSMVADHAEEYAQVLSLMECHYTRKQCWLKSDTQLLDDVHKIGHIPAVMVFGRYDLITPVANGWELQKAWPAAELVIIPDEGHAFNEPGIAEALVAATDYFV